VKKVNEKELRRVFGESLSQARAEQGVTLGRLSHESGIEVLNINAFEAGTILPGLDDLYAIAAALDMHPAELLPVLDGSDVVDTGARERTDEDDALYPVGDSGDDEEDDEDEDGARAGG
jgi:transcriptional regulator with XRE-family HTH domain